MIFFPYLKRFSLPGHPGKLIGCVGETEKQQRISEQKKMKVVQPRAS